MDLIFKYKSLLKIGILLTVFISASVAQSESLPSRQRRYVSLTVGLTHDEELPIIPKDAQFTGDFRKFTNVSIARELNTLRFTPKNTTGVGTLNIMDGQGHVLYEIIIDVKRSNLTKVAQEIQSLLSEIEGVTVKVLSNKVVVDGQVLLPKDVDRIHTVVKQYPGLAVSMVTLSPNAENKIAEIIEKEINNPEITCKARNHKFVLEGMANNKEDRERAEIIAKTYVPDVVMSDGVADGKIQERKVDAVINLINIKDAPEPEPPKLIQLVVHYVELKKDYNRGFRIQWMPSMDDKSGVTFSSNSNAGGGLVTSITGTINNLLPKLNWAKGAGFARVLQSSTLIVQDGTKGDIRNVNRYPVQVAGPQGQLSTDFVDAGIVSTITPRIIGSRSDSIELSMDFSVSAVLGSLNGAPIINQHSINTKVTVRSGQSAAVGGLISSDSSTDYNRLPANVSSNPLISLYASKDFQRNQSQFVTFVTPVIKTSASDGSEKIKKKFRLRE